ncbi:hypothetical protein [Paenibacillus lautus]|uniref:hypothetical protein n=1 Tax=Paenibacillus lautus TaxID=1401 RepID=UPI003D2BA69A
MNHSSNNLPDHVVELFYQFKMKEIKYFFSYQFYRIFPRFISIILIVIGIVQFSRSYSDSSQKIQIFTSISVVILSIIALIIDILGDKKAKYKSFYIEMRTIYTDLYTAFKDADHYKFFQEKLNHFEQQIDPIIAINILSGIVFYYKKEYKWISKQLDKKLMTYFLTWEVILIPFVIAIVIFIIMLAFKFTNIIFEIVA